MLQQNLYNENNRYLKWVFKNSNQFMDVDIIIILIDLTIMLIFYNNEFITIIGGIVISLQNVLFASKWRKNIKNDQNKKKLVVTARIKRLICTILILFAIPLVALGLHIYDSRVVWTIFLVLSLMTYLNAFVVFIAKVINTPIEKCL